MVYFVWYLYIGDYSYYTEYMRLGSVRDLEGNRPVLMNKDASGPDPVYWVFTDITEKTWKNMTIWATGRYGNSAGLNTNGEYPKTFGHYHGTAVNETYHLVAGEGIFVLQKKFLENGVWVAEKVEEILLITVKPGEDVVVTPEWGHSWSNIGETPLITFDNWSAGHSPTDYAMVEKLRGMAYYLIEENGKVKAVPNPNYRDLPEPKWITAEEFKRRG